MTAIPALIDIGPALIAFLPEVIEYPTPTAVSFSKNTVFVDAPPTGAPAGRFDKLEPSPLNEVAVKIPVTTAPVFVACTFVAAPNFNAEASIPYNCDPSPLNCVAVIIPEKVAFPLFENVTPVPKLIPVE